MLFLATRNIKCKMHSSVNGDKSTISSDQCQTNSKQCCCVSDFGLCMPDSRCFCFFLCVSLFPQHNQFIIHLTGFSHLLNQPSTNSSAYCLPNYSILKWLAWFHSNHQSVQFAFSRTLQNFQVILFLMFFASFATYLLWSNGFWIHFAQIIHSTFFIQLCYKTSLCFPRNGNS